MPWPRLGDASGRILAQGPDPYESGSVTASVLILCRKISRIFLDISIIIGIIMNGRIDKILIKMRACPKGIRFSDLCKICDHYFGSPRQAGTSHRIYRTPWSGDPRINIQDDRGMAKAYQVKQVLAAIARLEGQRELG